MERLLGLLEPVRIEWFLERALLCRREVVIQTPEQVANESQMGR